MPCLCSLTAYTFPRHRPPHLPNPTPFHWALGASAPQQWIPPPPAGWAGRHATQTPINEGFASAAGKVVGRPPLGAVLAVEGCLAHSHALLEGMPHLMTDQGGHIRIGYFGPMQDNLMGHFGSRAPTGSAQGLSLASITALLLPPTSASSQSHPQVFIPRTFLLMKKY